MWEFVEGNWLDLLLVLVGASALLIYWLQERRKKSEAASLIIMQVEELQKRMRTVKTYICEGQLNATAFYESQLLFKTDYWDKYKHYFIKKLEPFSLNMFDEFYSCACEVLAQQELMKNLQRNDFYLGQQMLMNMEANLVLQTMNTISQHPIENEKIIDGVLSSCPPEVSEEQKKAFENLFRQIGNANSVNDMGVFWSLYNKNKQTIVNAFNQKAFTSYTPAQIKISLEKALNQFDSIPIIGCDGYKKLKKIANRKF